MKKAVVFLIIPLFAICFSFETQAKENVYNEEYFSESLFSILDSEAADVLEEFGIDDLDYEKIFSVSFSQIAEYFQNDLKTTAKKCVSDFMLFVCITMVAGLVNSYFITDKKQNMLMLFSVVSATLILSAKITPLINMLLTTMKLNGNFMLAFIPIFTLIISLSGTPIIAVTYNSMTLALAEGISAFVNGFAVDMIGAFICISVSFAMNGMMNINRLINITNRTVSIIIGFIAGGFTGILSIKGIMSASVDTVSAKSIRFLLSSMIPVVGSSISDAYSSLVGSINLIKSSLAAVAILVVLIISLPAIFEATFYCVSFSLLSYLADVIECEQLSGIFRAFCTALRTLLLLSVLEIFILIISTGIMLTFKGGI